MSATPNNPATIPPAQTPLIQKTIIAFFVVTLNFAMQINSFTQRETQDFISWDWTDCVALLCLISGISTISIIISSLLSRLNLPLLRRIFNHIFLLALASGIFSLLTSYEFRTSRKFTLLWLALLFLIGYSFASRKQTILRLAKLLCLIFSPLILILTSQLVLASFPQATLVQTTPAPPDDEHKSPVIFIVFDEWSFDRSISGTSFIPELKNLNELTEQSTFYTQAYSPSNTTHWSLPSILYQTKGKLRQEGGASFFEQDGKRTSTDQIQNLFQLARTSGYKTHYSGLFLGHLDHLMNHADSSNLFSGTPRGDTFFQKIETALIRNTLFLTDVISWELEERAYAKLGSRRWYDLNKQLLEDTLRAISKSAPNTFTFIHWPIPHAPFVFNPDGSYYGDWSKMGGRMEGSPEDYHRHLLYLDNIIGQITDKLHETDTFDSSLLIFTSDHSWKKDLYTRESSVSRYPGRHVPLLVKLPDQKDKLVVSSQIINNELKSQIMTVLNDTAIQK